MRQDKDRSGKWLLTHHGDAILRLGGITGFSSWKALQAETVAPRRLPDGLLEVRFAGDTEPTLVLVEIETYPDSDADRQVLDDLMLIAVDRKTVPEVVSLVLKPKGNLNVTGASDRTSPRGRTRIGGSWPVVRLWELDAETLLNSPDVGFIPWAPLARTTLSPDELMTRCRDRLVQVPDANDRAGLVAVTQILAGLAFPDRRFLKLFGGAEVMIESPVLDEVKEILRQRYEADGRRKALQEAILANLEARFGAVPPERVESLKTITDENRLKTLLRLAATCPDLDAFVAGLTAAP
jgi:hypothetical protein